jgi:hypothetical protein
MYNTKSRYKVITCKVKDQELEAQLYEHCRDGHFTWLRINPQKVIRAALYGIGAFTGDSHKMYGDKSDWEPGLSIKTSFYSEDADQVRAFAEGQGMTVQQLITEAVRDHFVEVSI